jgi:hypothetical protein
MRLKAPARNAYDQTDYCVALSLKAQRQYRQFSSHASDLRNHGKRGEPRQQGQQGNEMFDNQLQHATSSARRILPDQTLE